MSKRQIIMILGVLVAIIQFLGFPSSWNKFFTFVCGLIILFIAYRMAPRVKVSDEKPVPYVENNVSNEIIGVEDIMSTNTQPTQ